MKRVILYSGGRVILKCVIIKLWEVTNVKNTLLIFHRLFVNVQTVMNSKSFMQCLQNQLPLNARINRDVMWSTQYSSERNPNICEARHCVFFSLWNRRRQDWSLVDIRVNVIFADKKDKSVMFTDAICLNMNTLKRTG